VGNLLLLAGCSIGDLQRYLSEDPAPTVVQPLGSTELHGPLPMGIDTIFASAVAREVAQRVNCALAPAIPYGHSPEHVGPGVVWLPASIYAGLVESVVDSLLDGGFSVVLLVNGHAGNSGILEAVARQVRRRRRAEVLIADLWQLVGRCIEGGDFYGYCVAEASLTMHLVGTKPSVSGEAGEERAPSLSARLEYLIRPWLTDEIEGSLEEAIREASKEMGQEIFGRVVEWIVSDLEVVRREVGESRG